MCLSKTVRVLNIPPENLQVSIRYIFGGVFFFLCKIHRTFGMVRSRVATYRSFRRFVPFSNLSSRINYTFRYYKRALLTTSTSWFFLARYPLRASTRACRIGMFQHTYNNTNNNGSRSTIFILRTTLSRRDRVSVWRVKFARKCICADNADYARGKYMHVCEFVASRKISRESRF